jgi:3',5'-cyclic AMP phosphodiesterase CpdA
LLTGRRLWRWVLVCVAVGALTACGASVSEQSASVTLAPTPTSIPATVVPSPVPATSVPTSTATPSDSPTEAYPAEPPSAGLAAESIATVTSRAASLPFTFVTIGDTQDPNPNDTSASEIFALLIEQINELRPDFVIHLGDVSDRGTAIELDRFDGLIAALDAPIITVAGNHDTKSRRKLFGERYVSPNVYTGLMDYSFDYGGVRFIVLDNSEYYLSSEQLEWLERQLQTSRRKIVSMHCPPDYGRWKDLGGMYLPEKFMALMKTYEVELVYSGHIHLHNYMKVAGTKYVISGCGGGTLSSRDLGIRQHGFDIVRVGVEEIQTEFVPLSVRKP